MPTSSLASIYFTEHVRAVERAASLRRQARDLSAKGGPMVRFVPDLLAKAQRAEERAERYKERTVLAS